jgi:hypothetical protein
MQDTKRRLSVRQELFLTAAEVVERRARVLGSPQAAVDQLNVLIRIGRLTRYRLTIDERDSTEHYVAVEETLGLVIAKDHGVFDLDWVDVYFRQIDIEKLWPMPAEQLSEPLEQPGETGRRRGPKPKYDWDAINCEIIWRLGEGGEPDNIEAFAMEIFEWCEKQFVPGQAPSIQHLRAKVIPNLIDARRRASPA